jgi:hypothetical protein
MNVIKYTLCNNETIEVNPETINDLYARRQLIELIKMYRALTGMGLKESKDIVQKYEREINGGAALYASILQNGRDPQVLAVKEELRVNAQQLQAEKEADLKKREEDRKANLNNLMDKTILNMKSGVAIAFASYVDLGYDNPFEAARGVVDRHETVYIHAKDALER